MNATTADTIRTRLERTTAWDEASHAQDALRQATEAALAIPQAQLDRLRTADRIVLTGAGSSYYVAQVAAAAMREVCRLPAAAVPLSEIILRPTAVFHPVPAGRQPVVVISRSGTTSEAVAVVEQAASGGHPVLAVTCRPQSRMAELAEGVLPIPAADEAAIVMTRSFASMTTALLRLGARLAPDRLLGDDLDRMPASWPETGPFVDAALDLAAEDPSRVVVLGGGAAFGLACEAVLKLTETGQVPANAWEPLEFRHGPISLCEPGMLVVAVLGGGSEAAERKVVDEARALGATTWVLGPDGPGGGLHEVARLPLVLHPLQALAFGVAIRRGCDPEAPRHLDQVVVLDEA